MTLPPWTVEARNEALLDRIAADQEHHGNGRRCCLGRECRGSGDRGDHRHPLVDQFGRQGRQSVVATVRPAVFDRHVLALDVAGIFQTGPECIRI